MENKTNSELSLYERARDFAIKAHRNTNCLYDGKHYGVHLMMVVHVAKKYKHLLRINLKMDDTEIEQVMCACWLHDVYEDCRITYNDLKKVFGVEIAEIVFALTNNKGRTRKERAGDDYYDQIILNPAARFVKICDRIANVTYSKENQSKMIHVYREENAYFISKLNCYNDPLQNMFDELNDILNNEE